MSDRPVGRLAAVAAAFLLMSQLPLSARPADGAGDVAAGAKTASLLIAGDAEPAPFVPNVSEPVSGPRTNIVITLADSGPGSLRQAVADSFGGDTVMFDPLLAGGTITLASGQILIDKDLSVSGLGSAGVTVSGNNTSRIFEVATGVTAVLEDLTITEGRASGDPAKGGGVLNSGTLTLRRMTFFNNTAAGGYAYGGGLCNGGNVTVDRCTFRNNAAIGGGGDFGCDGRGGAIYDAVNRNLVVFDSTFNGNCAQGGTGRWMNGSGMGGAICDGNATPDSGSKVLANCTISGNTVSGDIARGGGCLMTHQAVYDHVTIIGNSASEGGGVYSANYSNPSIVNPVLRNCILANNSASYGPDLKNAFESGGFNLIKNTNSWIQSGGMTGNRYGADPLLGPLADNGGPTFTCLPQAGSPAIDAITPASDSTAADQRGVLRPQGAASDIGSVEVEVNLSSVIPNAGPFAGGNTVTITNGNFGTVSNVLVGGVAATIQTGGPGWLTITMPATGAAGVKNIVIQTSDRGDITLPAAYTVNPAGRIWDTSGVAPREGSCAGGYPVVLSGTNLCDGTLADVTRVTLCGVDAAVLGVSASTQIVVTAGAGVPGVGDVRVFSASHGETVKAGAFEYLRVPQIPLAFEPASPQAYGTTNVLSVSGGSGTGAVSFAVLEGPGVIVDGTNLAVTAGSGTVRVCATKAGDALYVPVAVTSTVAAVQGTQTIDFPPLADQVATNVVALGASASSGLAVTFSVAGGPASLDGNVLRFTGAGRVSVVASQLGDANWSAASETTNSFDVARAGATVTLANLSQTYDGTPRAVTATTVPAGLAVSFRYGERQGLGVVGSGDAPVPAGRYAVTGTIIDDFYSGMATGTLVVAKAAQTIDFPPIAPQAVTSIVALAATGGASGNPVTFSVVSGPGLIAGEGLSFSAAGEVAVVASQAGTENYNAAPDVTNLVSVSGVVLSVIPQHGVKAGGDQVRIDGLWLGDGTNITSVTLCGVEATIVSQAIHSVWVLSGATTITADLTGPVHVVSGFGNAAQQDAFTYHVLAPPIALPATQISSAAFKAHWSLVPEVDHYVIDVSTTSNFTDFVAGYSNQFVGATDNAWVNGLADGTWYWYRLRACTSNDVQSLNSNVIGLPTGETVPWVTVSNMTGTASSGGVQEFPLNLIFAGAGLSFSATSDAPAIVTAQIDAATGVLRLTYPGAAGMATITVTATHLGTGYQVSYVFSVTVIGAPAYGVGALQSSSMEVCQIVTVTNTADVAAEGVMVTVGGLDDTAYVLNRTSVNGRGEAVIEYPHSLAPGASAAIKVAYARAYGAQVLQGRPATVEAHLVLSPLREAPPAEAVASAVVGAWRREDGCMVIAFRSVPGAEYMIQYRDSMSGAWKNIYPAVTASGTVTYWVDSGQPVTEAHPKDVSARFYQILSYPNN